MSGAVNTIALIVVGAVIVLLVLRTPKLLRELLSDIRPYRILHYELMCVFGIVLAANTPSYELTSSSLLAYVNLVVSIFLACVFSLITNNIADVEIDIVSNPTRPLVRNAVNLDSYWKVAWGALFLSFLCATVVGLKSLFFVSLFVLGYYVYSMPPLRLKRITFFSKLLISINSLSFIGLGYTFAGADIDSFPREVFWFFIIAYTTAINFIDLKDVDGDRKAGIKSIPVLIGLKNAQLLMGFCFLIGHVLAYYVVKQPMVLFVVMTFGFVQFFLLNRKNYDERPVFVIYLATVVILIMYVARNGLQIG